jgi:hypothetical protein
MVEALSSFETWDLTRGTRRNIPEDGILHSHRREHPKSYPAMLFTYSQKYVSKIRLTVPTDNPVSAFACFASLCNCRECSDPASRVIVHICADLILILVAIRCRAPCSPLPAMRDLLNSA